MGVMSDLDVRRQELQERPAGTVLALSVCEDCRAAIAPVSWASARQTFRRDLIAYVWHGWRLETAAIAPIHRGQACESCFIQPDHTYRFAVLATREARP